MNLRAEVLEWLLFSTWPLLLGHAVDTSSERPRSEGSSTEIVAALVVPEKCFQGAVIAPRAVKSEHAFGPRGSSIGSHRAIG